MQISEATNSYLHWLAVARQPSQHTIRAYASDLEQLERVLGASFDVRTLAEHHLHEFVAAQRLRQISEASIRRRLAAIRGFTKWLYREQVTTSEDPVHAKIEVRLAKRLPRAVPQPDLTRLLRHLCREARIDKLPANQAVERHHTASTTLLAVALMLATGLRVGEVVTARAADTHTHAGTMRIIGKGSRERVVVYDGRLLDSLLPAYLGHRDHAQVSHPYLLHSAAGDPLTTEALRRRVAGAARDAGLSLHVTPHALRHSAATQLIESGVDIRFVQRLLGHASISTTELYTQVTNVALARAIRSARVLDQLLDAA